MVGIIEPKSNTKSLWWPFPTSRLIDCMGRYQICVRLSFFFFRLDDFWMSKEDMVHASYVWGDDLRISISISNELDSLE